MTNADAASGDTDLDALATGLMEGLAGAPRHVLEAMLHEVETRDLYRESVQAILDEQGIYVDALGLCPDLAPDLAPDPA